MRARLPRTQSIALIDEWGQRQPMRDCQSESDRIRNELEHTELPSNTQEYINQRNVELDKTRGLTYTVL
jgi:hypothetical protein